MHGPSLRARRTRNHFMLSCIWKEADDANDTPPERVVEPEFFCRTTCARVPSGSLFTGLNLSFAR